MKRRKQITVGMVLSVLKTAPALISDFDGVHTDDSAYLNQDGGEIVRVSRSDGMGVRILQSQGVQLVVISLETNRIVKTRAEKLGVECFWGIEDKASTFENWCNNKGFETRHCIYVGNDINDLDCMGISGLSLTVRDAKPDAARIADLILDSKGGEGAIREIAELVAISRSTKPRDMLTTRLRVLRLLVQRNWRAGKRTWR